MSVVFSTVTNETRVDILVYRLDHRENTVVSETLKLYLKGRCIIS
jgi:hypothetical protein